MHFIVLYMNVNLILILFMMFLYGFNVFKMCFKDIYFLSVIHFGGPDESRKAGSNSVNK